MAANLSRWLFTHRNSLPFKILRNVLSGTSDLLFGWIDRRLVQKHQRQLERDISGTLPFLFSVHHGRMVPSEGIPTPVGFDYAFITVDVGKVLIRFCRGRGDLGISVASKATPNVWHELCLVLNLIEGREHRQRYGILNLRDAAQLLHTYMDKLNEAFLGSPGNHLEQQLAEVYAHDRISMRETEWEINERFRSS